MVGKTFHCAKIVTAMREQSLNDRPALMLEQALADDAHGALFDLIVGDVCRRKFANQCHQKLRIGTDDVLHNVIQHTGGINHFTRHEATVNGRLLGIKDAAQE